MTSLVFDPKDLDFSHISNVIVRTVQASLTPKIQSGRGDVMLVPKFTSKFYRDAMPVGPLRRSVFFFLSMCHVF